MPASRKAATLKCMRETASFMPGRPPLTPDLHAAIIEHGEHPVEKVGWTVHPVTTPLYHLNLLAKNGRYNTIPYACTVSSELISFCF